MVSASQGRVQRRQATLEAACRVALRMVKTDRGRDAALQFLVDVAGRQFDGSATIILNPVNGNAPSPDGPEDGWSIPIRSDKGLEIGELRLRPSSGSVEDATRRALETVADGVATVIRLTDAPH